MRATVYGEELKPLREFMRDMITQYQTSLGLVSSFPRDSGSRFKKRPAVGRGQANYRAGREAKVIFGCRLLVVILKHEVRLFIQKSQKGCKTKSTQYYCAFLSPHVEYDL